jgi:hypothetical protein
VIAVDDTTPEGGPANRAEMAAVGAGVVVVAVDDHSPGVEPDDPLDHRAFSIARIRQSDEVADPHGRPERPDTPQDQHMVTGKQRRGHALAGDPQAGEGQVVLANQSRVRSART